MAKGKGGKKAATAYEAEGRRDKNKAAKIAKDAKAKAKAAAKKKRK